MKSKFPFSLENIPKQKSFACLSLKFGSIISALILILYSVFALAQCLAAFHMIPSQETPNDYEAVLIYALVIGASIAHTVTLFLSALMLVGALREKGWLMKPWIVWTTLQVIIAVIMFVFWSTISIINHTNDNSLLIYIVEFLGLMIRFYMLMIVSSYFKQMEEEGTETEKLRNLINSETWYSAA